MTASVVNPLAVQAYAAAPTGWQPVGAPMHRGSELAAQWPAFVLANRSALLLFRCAGEPLPDVPQVQENLNRARAEVLHYGAGAYAAGMPCLRFTQPAYLPLVLPAGASPYSSGELQLDGCAVGVGVLERAAPPCGEFEGVQAAASALGWEWFHGGVIVRAVGGPEGELRLPDQVSAADQLHFMRRFFGDLWMGYVACRLVTAGMFPPAVVARAVMDARRHRCRPAPLALRRTVVPTAASPATVAVLIPTVDRVAYLRAALEQLRAQTHRAAQVIVVDQTPEASRDLDLEADFPDLPLHVVRLQAAGQSSARNAGIHHVRADWTLLLDDDIDFPPTLIAQHVALCEATGADVCVGVATEDGVAPLPEAQRGWRLSPVLMGGNSLVRTALLREVGGFDLAFDGGSRADGDLGLRLQRAGALMLLDGANSLHHHHAPRGGLRVHKARTVTRASARQRIWGRHPVVATELYICLRHFGEWSLREVRLLRLFSGLRMDGGRLAQVARLTVGVLTLWREWRRQEKGVAQARVMAVTHPSLEDFERCQIQGRS
jgi:glycosyltransferase involved in cell wall biosynthesis